MSQNRTPINPFPCLVRDGFLWLALD